MNNNALITGIIIVVVIVGGIIWFSSRSTMTTPLATTTPLTDQQTVMGDPDMDIDMMAEGTNSPIVSPLVSTSPMTSPSTTTGATTAGTVKNFTVTGSNFKFDPSTITVKQGDTVRVTFKNASGTHDWNLDDFNVHTKMIQGGQQEVVEFVANKKGQFEYYCSVGNHRQMGMKGTLVVE